MSRPTGKGGAGFSCDWEEQSIEVFNTMDNTEEGIVPRGGSRLRRL